MDVQNVNSRGGGGWSRRGKGPHSNAQLILRLNESKLEQASKAKIDVRASGS